jgi:UDP-glucuronate 4-epimerase
MESLFHKNDFDVVINLAAQAGVRYSLENPHAYIESNIDGFLNILEGCRHGGVDHLVYASSSSVYGSNKEMPFKTSDRVDHPVSLYAATKKSNELMAHTYSHLYGIPATGLRFFTVYGPWGRPDMALFIFTKAIVEGKPIQVFNHGEMQRDFTYIDDIVESITRLIPKTPESNNRAPHNLFNIGHNSPVKLMDFIHEIEKNLGKEADKQMMPIQPGDVPATWADVSDLFEMIDYKPKVGIEEGVKAFIDWYKGYYGV